MKKHELIFEKIKTLLNRQFPDQIEENENGMYLSVKYTGLWISSDPRELTVGYGMTHVHCNPEYDDLDETVDLFFNLMTCKRKITKYYKGDFSYKHRVDLILKDNEIYNLALVSESLNFVKPRESLIFVLHTKNNIYGTL